MNIFESQKDHSDHGVENGLLDVSKLPGTEDVIILRTGNESLNKKSGNGNRYGFKRYLQESVG